jgi:hypothetical protein
LKTFGGGSYIQLLARPHPTSHKNAHSLKTYVPSSNSPLENVNESTLVAVEEPEKKF